MIRLYSQQFHWLCYTVLSLNLSPISLVVPTWCFRYQNNNLFLWFNYRILSLIQELTSTKQTLNISEKFSNFSEVNIMGHSRKSFALQWSLCPRNIPPTHFNPTIFTRSHGTLKSRSLFSEVLMGCLNGLAGSGVGHRFNLPDLKSRREHAWMVCHASLRLITFAGHSTHSAYLVHQVAIKHQTVEVVVLTTIHLEPITEVGLNLIVT